jgi:hypothetical protein
MSAVAFNNDGNWLRWRELPHPARVEAERKTIATIADLLRNGGSLRAFPDFPIIIRREDSVSSFPEEVPWNTADLALDHARVAKAETRAPLLELWASVGMSKAKAQIRQWEGAWRRGDAPMPEPRQPDRFDRSDLGRLGELTAPLVLVPDPADPAGLVLAHSLAATRA